MKKSVLSAAAGIVGLILVSPVVIGHFVCEQFDALVEELNTAPHLHGEIVHLDHGWFDTHARVDVQYSSHGELFTIPVDVHSQNGLLRWHEDAPLALARIRLSVNAESTPSISTQATGPVLIADWIKHINGNFSMRSYSETFTLTTETLDLQVQPWAIKADSQAQMTDFTLALEGVTYQFNQDTRLSIRGITMDMLVDAPISHLFASLLYPSDGMMRVDSISISTPELEQYTIAEDLYGYGKLDLDAEDIGELEMEYKVGRVGLGGDHELTDVQFTLLANRLDVRQTNEWLMAINAINARTKFDQSDEQAILQATRDIGGKILASQPRFSIPEFSGRVNDMPFSMDLQAKINLFEKIDVLEQDGQFWLEHLLANANISVDKALADLLARGSVAAGVRHQAQSNGWSKQQTQQAIAEESQKMLNGLMAQGLVTQSKLGLSSHIHFANNEMTINDKTIPLGLK